MTGYAVYPSFFFVESILQLCNVLALCFLIRKIVIMSTLGKNGFFVHRNVAHWIKCSYLFIKSEGTKPDSGYFDRDSKFVLLNQIFICCESCSVAYDSWHGCSSWMVNLTAAWFCIPTHALPFFDSLVRTLGFSNCFLSHRVLHNSLHPPSYCDLVLVPTNLLWIHVLDQPKLANQKIKRTND